MAKNPNLHSCILIICMLTAHKLAGYCGVQQKEKEGKTDILKSITTNFFGGGLFFVLFCFFVFSKDMLKELIPNGIFLNQGIIEKRRIEKRD